MTLRVACVGAGYFAQFHYDSWARMDRVTQVGACDTDIAKAEATGRPAFADLATMLDQQKPDLLDIILPPVGHAAAITTALDAGIKWIICQKPFCQNMTEAAAINARADAAGATIIVHENFRFQPWFRAIKSAIDAGHIGDLRQATFRLRPGDGQGPDAYLERQPYFRDMDRLLIHETGVHYFDVFRYLIGEPTAIYADLRRENPVIKGEDAGHVIIDFANGARALLDGNRTLDHAADNLRCTMGEGLIEGTQGTLALTGDGAVTLRAFHATTAQQILAPSTWDGFGGDCVHALQSHVVAGILDGTPLENRSADYMRILQIENAAYDAAKDGRKRQL